MPRIKHKPNPTKLIAQFMMVASTVVMGGFLIMGGMLLGSGGVGLFGEPVGRLQQLIGQGLVLSGIILLPVAFLMLRKEVQRYVFLALGIVTLDLAGYVVAQHTFPMFGIVYGLALAISYKISR